MREKVPVYILSGGKSTRFGKDKATAIYKGIPLILHIAKSIQPIAETITIVADRPKKYDNLGLRTIGDTIKWKGPIGGLQAAIMDYNHDGWFFLTSCDLLGIRLKWLQELLLVPRDNACIIAYKSNIWEPLFTLYHTSVINVVNHTLSVEGAALWKIFENVTCINLPYPDDWNSSLNINTQKDLEYYKSSLYRKQDTS